MKYPFLNIDEFKRFVEAARDNVDKNLKEHGLSDFDLERDYLSGPEFQADDNMLSKQMALRCYQNSDDHETDSED